MTDVLFKVASAETSGIDLSLESVVLPLFVREIANEMQEDFQRKKIEIDFVQITQVPPVLLDRKQIKLVIMTLLHNAVFYSKDDAKVRVAFREEKGYVVVEIIDDGIGIEKSEIPKVFERFYRGDAAREVDQQGLGIGLYMSRKIVGLHNGSLTLYSEGKGKGTAALLALPEKRESVVSTLATTTAQ
jgi:two-component system phosphate regulon sensor histidine kinase PhoR